MPFAPQAHRRPAALVLRFLRHYSGNFSVLLGAWRATVIFAPRGDMAAAFSPNRTIGAWVQAFNAGMIEALVSTRPPEANVSVLRKNLATCTVAAR